jgi:plastocyanin
MRKVMSLVAAIVAASLATQLPNAPAARAGGTGGTIKGKVTYASDIAKANQKDMTADKDPEVCLKERLKSALLVDAASKGLEDAVVSIKGKVANARPFTDAEKAVTLDQKTCQFDKHVTLIAEGGTITFKNSDGALHNIKFSSTNNGTFNKGVGAGTSESLPLKAPEFITVECSVHPWMSGVIVVMAHPYYAVSNKTGEYEIKDVPAGKYMILAQHQTEGKSPGPKGVEVVVKDGETVTHDFEFKK